jgi:hypothetical protein
MKFLSYLVLFILSVLLFTVCTILLFISGIFLVFAAFCSVVLLTFVWFIYSMIYLHVRETDEIRKMGKRNRSEYLPHNDVNLFNRGTEYLEELKRSQWNNAYYILLIYAATFTIRKLVVFQSIPFTYIFLLLSLIVFEVYFYTITGLQYRMRNSRVALQQHEEIYRMNLYWMNDAEFKNHCKRDHKVLRDINIYTLFILVGTAALVFIVFYIINTANPSLQLR